MADEARTQQGQAGPGDPAAEADAGTGARQEPQLLIRESIKYRRRAQDAERRAEALEAEVRALREAQQADAGTSAQELAAARAEAEALRRDLDALGADRRLERAFLKAGCTDPEAAVAVARLRLAGGALPEDAEGLAREILAEKPHLAAGPGTPALPPRTAGAKPAGASAARGTVERLADQARRTGRPGDVAAYMRARRSIST